MQAWTLRSAVSAHGERLKSLIKRQGQSQNSLRQYNLPNTWKSELLYGNGAPMRSFQELTFLFNGLEQAD